MQIPVNFAQVNYTLTISTYPFLCETTVGISTSEYAGTGGELVDTVYDVFADNLLNRLTSNVILSKVAVKFGPNSTGTTIEVTGTAAGADGSTTVGPMEALLVTKQTALGGRQGRGRFYLPGASSAKLNPSGLWDASWLVSAQADADAWLADMLSADIPPVLLHSEGSSDTTPEPITSLSVQGRVASQRRRNRR